MTESSFVAVLSGGPSAEREVSLRSGRAVAAALREAGCGVAEVDPVPGALQLPEGVRLAFVALHGSYGEDGGVQRELEALGVPYTGSDAEASGVAFDKAAAKQRFRAAGVPIPAGVVLRESIGSEGPWPPGAPPPPVVVKPVRQGSSVGLGFASDTAELSAALDRALEFDSEALVEERIDGREVTVGVLDGRALPVVEVRPLEGSYDYQNKYTPGRTEYLCPAPFPGEVAARIQGAALAAFQAVGARDYARVDIIVRPDGSPVVLEVNTLPGMTETSLLPKAAAAAGIPFTDLCLRMAAMARTRARPTHP